MNWMTKQCCHLFDIFVFPEALGDVRYAAYHSSVKQDTFSDSMAKNKQCVRTNAMLSIIRTQ